MYMYKDAGFLRGGGSNLDLHAKRGGGPGGPALDPVLKSRHRGQRGGGGPDALAPSLITTAPQLLLVQTP